jgi:hypothetical protein
MKFGITLMKKFSGNRTRKLLALMLVYSAVFMTLPSASTRALVQANSRSRFISGAGFAETISNSSLSKPDQATQKRIRESYGRLPLLFEANEGQTDKRVRFLSRGKGYNLFLTDTEAILALSSGDLKLVDDDHEFLEKYAKSLNHEAEPGDPRSTVVRLGLIGTNPIPKVFGLEAAETKSNYFIGNNKNNWQTSVTNYTKVRYEGVYPGIDMVYYGNQEQFEFDFVVAPGASPSNIELDYRGADSIELNDKGDLILHIGDGEIRQNKPLVYQMVDGVKQQVLAEYFLKDKGRVGFRLAHYDPSRQLIIDPVLSYSTFLGGIGVGPNINTGLDQANDIAVDSDGNAYITGFTTSEFPAVNGSQSINRGLVDIFIVKLDSSGTSISYSTTFGGSLIDRGISIAVDRSGSAYVTGITGSPDFPLVNALQQSSLGSFDAFVMKLNTAGSAIVYSTYLSGSGLDRGAGITVDAVGNVYVTGQTLSTDFPTRNSLQSSNNGLSDVFVAKLNSAGSALLFSTYLGGSKFDVANSIALDSSGNLYLTGSTSSLDFPLMNPLQSENKGSDDLFVTKLNSAGSALLYSTYLGGSDQDIGYAIAVDSTGNAYVTGITNSVNFPLVNALQSIHLSSDAFVAKLNMTGSMLVYSTFLGGDMADQGNGIGVDSAGNAYIVGYTFSTDFPTINALTGSRSSRKDAFVAKLDSTGNKLLYSTYLGGSSNDEGSNIAIDSIGNAFVVGATASTDFLVMNPLQANSRGNGDAFVTKISPAGRTLAYSTYLGSRTGFDQGSSITVDSSGNAYVTGFTNAVDFPLSNPEQPLNRGVLDLFVTKLNATGTALAFSTFIGGTGDDKAIEIELDAAGNIYVAGETASIDFPMVNSIGPGLMGERDVFVVKLNAAGNALSYSTYLGKGGAETVVDMAVSSDGNAFLFGDTDSTDFPTINALQPTFGGLRDTFLSKLSKTGDSLIYSTYLGGSGLDAGGSIALDSDDNVYLTGRTESTDFPINTPLQARNNGSTDAFVTKLDAEGGRTIFSTYLGGSGSDGAKGIAVDSSGNVYLTGSTTSNDFPLLSALQPSLKGDTDTFVTKLNASGSELSYSTYIGGKLADIATDIAVDPAGNVYVAGSTSSTDFPVNGALQASYGGSSDAFIFKLNLTGNIVFSSYLGGREFDAASDIAVNLTGNLYVIGQSFSSNFPTMKPIQATNGGGFDVFVTKIILVGPPPALSSFTPVSGGVGTTVLISGTNFTGTLMVAFNGTLAPFNIDSPTLIRATVPSGAKTGPILVTTLDGKVTSNLSFRVLPKIMSFTPNSGIAGESITITGTNLKIGNTAPTVKIGAVAATVTSASDTEIIVSIPAAALTGRITVATSDGTATSPADFIVVRAPVISTFTPVSGPVGTSVMISGANISSATDVQFNGRSAGPITVINANSIKANVPVGATTGKLSVTNRAGTVTSTAIFKVLPKILGFTPSSGIAGESVAITGTSFGSNPTVKFGTTLATLTSASDTEIIATIPPTALTGKVSLTTVDGTAISSTNFIVIRPPTISSFSPAVGPVGTSVAISGTNLSAVIDVQFNGKSATTITVVSPTSIRAVVPIGTTTGKITLVNRAGTTTSIALFKVSPKIVGFTPSKALPGETITIQGSNFSGATAVRFGFITATPFTIDSDTQITVKVPTTAITGRVSVTTPNGIGTSTENFTVIKQPTVSSFTPASGRAGTVVTIFGSNISSATDVKFNGVSVTEPIVVVSVTSIKVTVPAGATTGKITVTNRAGTATSSGIFTLLQ